ncbi:hypothetical protein OG609_37815 [Streptomyces sp. NBC_01224]|uniref:hypothetical protein n=1 Tax=Streptomyces sp. NBC_01224 TaxID=2903783 RepID=UPI002E0FC7C4|nr:hypothetical protein OG609_37815 [Streptomyces sp. NBC_01224]
MTPGRCCRAVRAAVFAATCVLLAALGHVLMSGTAVPWWAMAAAFAATAATAWFLSGSERGVLAVTSMMVAAQAALHTGFSLAQTAVHPSVADTPSFARQWAQSLLCGPTSSTSISESEAVRIVTDAGLGSRLHQPPPGSTDMTMPGGMQHAHAGLQTMTDPSTVMPTGHYTGGMSPAGMLAAHLLAALLCGLWLAYGERATFRLLRTFAGWIAAPLHLLFRLPTPLDRPRIRARRDYGARTPRQLFLIHALTSRGPPSGIAVV